MDQTITERVAEKLLKSELLSVKAVTMWARSDTGLEILSALPRHLRDTLTNEIIAIAGAAYLVAATPDIHKEHVEAALAAIMKKL